jgi:hypothetical protein
VSGWSATPVTDDRAAASFFAAHDAELRGRLNERGRIVYVATVRGPFGSACAEGATFVEAGEAARRLLYLGATGGA